MTAAATTAFESWTSQSSQSFRTVTSTLHTLACTEQSTRELSVSSRVESLVAPRHAPNYLCMRAKIHIPSLHACDAYELKKPRQHSSLLLGRIGKLGGLTLEVNYRATTTGDDAPRATQFGFDGLHEREPGEHTRGDIRAPGRLPRQVTPRGAHARRPPTARRIGTHRGEFNSFTHDPTHPLTARRALPVHPPSIPRAQGTLKSNELYELVRLTTAFGVDGLPDGAHSLESTNQTQCRPENE